MSPDTQAIALNNIGLAHKRMDNINEALRYYEEAIVLDNSDSSGAIHSYKILREEASKWYGTSRRMTLWGPPTEFTWNRKCAKCGKVTTICNDCHIARYCKSTCGEEHWKLHKATCWGRGLFD